MTNRTWRAAWSLYRAVWRNNKPGLRARNAKLSVSALYGPELADTCEIVMFAGIPNGPRARWFNKFDQACFYYRESARCRIFPRKGGFPEHVSRIIAELRRER